MTGMPPELGFLSHSASLPWLLGAAALLSLGAILVLAGLTALFGLHPLRFVSRTLLGLLLISLGLLEGTITVGIQGYRSLAPTVIVPSRSPSEISKSPRRVRLTK